MSSIDSQDSPIPLSVFGDMPKAAATEVVEGMVLGGIDFAVILAESEFKTAQLMVDGDDRIQSVMVSNETVGVPICGGAWAGGKRPAMMIGASGFPMTSYPLTWIANCHQMPMLLLITTRTIGDEHYIYGVASAVVEPFLEGLNIPIRRLRKIEDTRRVIADAANTCFAWLRPVAVLLSDELIDDRARDA